MQGREDLADLSTLVDSSADEVAVGIERASAFLMTRQDGGGLGRIYLSGGGARIPGMTDALSSRNPGGWTPTGVSIYRSTPFRALARTP